MPYPIEERLKNLEQDVRQLAEQFAVGQSCEDKVFHGIVQDTYNDSEFTYCYLLVAPLMPYTPPQTGDIHFLELGDDPQDLIPDPTRLDKVYVLNLPPQGIDGYYQPGDIVTYWHYSGITTQADMIRGSYCTYWCNQGQVVVKITSTTSGSGVYNGKRMTQVGTVGSLTSPRNLNMPPSSSIMPESEDCLVINLAENGLVTGSHWVPLPTWTIGLQVAITDYGIATAETPAVAVSIPLQGFWAQIGASAGTYSGGGGGSYAPWKYAWTEQSDTLSAGIEHFQNKPSGRSGTTSTNYAMNSWEYSPAGKYCPPIPSGTYVWMEITIDDQTPANLVYRFNEVGPALNWCKVAYDSASGAVNTIQVTPCDVTGTTIYGPMSSVRITGHQLDDQGYLNLKAGDVVRYLPACDDGTNIGMLAHLPIVPTTSAYACLQVTSSATVEEDGSTSGGTVGFDWVRSHS